MKVLEQSLHLSFKMNHRGFVSKDQTPLILNESSCIYPEKKDTQYLPQTIQETSTQPIFVPKSAVESNYFSALSFSNMP